MKKIRSVLVGCGKIGYSYGGNNQSYIQSHFRAIEADERFELIAAIEENPKLRAQINHKHDVQCLGCISDLKTTRFSDIDLIIISTTEAQKNAVLSQLVEYEISPKFILYEKPLATTFREMSLISNLLKQIKCEFRLNFIRRADPNYRWLAKNINEVLGTFKNLKLNISFSGDMHNSLSHGIDFLIGLLGTEILSDLKVRKLSDNWLVKNDNVELLIRKIDIGINIFDVILFSSCGKIEYEFTDEILNIKRVGSWYEFPGKFYTSKVQNLTLSAQNYMQHVYTEVARYFEQGNTALTTVDEAKFTFGLIEKLRTHYE